MIALFPIVLIAGIGLTVYANSNITDTCIKPCETSVAGRTLVKHFEGFSPVTYIDAAGHPTIGYGHLIKDGEVFNEPISPEEAEQLLRRDLREAEKAVNRKVAVTITQNQFDALSSFTFNLGSGNLKRSTLLRKVNSEDHEEATSEFNKWVYAGGKKLKGLVLRRMAESKLYGLS